MERGESPPRGQTASEARSTRRLILMAWLVSTVWLIALIQPAAAALASRSAGHITLTLAGLALFLTLYLWATGSDAREFAMTAQPAPQPLWRRALPAALITALAFAMTLGLDIGWGTLFIFAAVSAARRLPIRPALIATALLALIPFTGTISHGVPTLATALQNAGLVAVVGVTVIGMRWSFITNRELRIARRELTRLAITDERLRFARDLHDLLGHTLSLIALKSELAGRLVTTAPERAQVELTGIERAARQALCVMCAPPLRVIARLRWRASWTPRASYWTPLVSPMSSTARMSSRHRKSRRRWPGPRVKAAPTPSAIVAPTPARLPSVPATAGSRC